MQAFYEVGIHRNQLPKNAGRNQLSKTYASYEGRSLKNLIPKKAEYCEARFLKRPKPKKSTSQEGCLPKKELHKKAKTEKVQFFSWTLPVKIEFREANLLKLKPTSKGNCFPNRRFPRRLLPKKVASHEGRNSRNQLPEKAVCSEISSQNDHFSKDRFPKSLFPRKLLLINLVSQKRLSPRKHGNQDIRIPRSQVSKKANIRESRF